jgi:glycosyltransferase involved in cell wall biosynthesis
LHSVEVIVSTMHYSDGKLDALLNSIPDHIPVTVINQEPGVDALSGGGCVIRHGARYFTFSEAGLSRSRNRAIQLAEADFLVVCDDDIVFEAGAFERLQESLRQYPEDALLTFQMADLSGNPRKRYRCDSFRHNRWSIAKVSSCEIGFWRETIMHSGVRYDEEFGLGARFPLGEEVVFLKDCLDKGLSLRFVPMTISRHPIESTGRRIDATSERSRGALFYRLYGLLAWVIGPVFYLTKWRQLPETLGMFNALQAYRKGCYALLKTRG